jgi:aryl sulfotransferase
MTGPTVWLASYPKSGNTWMRALFTAWRSGAPIHLDELEGAPMAAGRTVFAEELGVLSTSLTHDEVDLLRPRVDEVLAARAGGPLLRKVHDAYLSGPAGEPILSVAATRCALYLIRDPRDVAVSYAHHHGRPFAWACGHMSDPRATVDVDGDPVPRHLRQRLGTWSGHVRSWVDEARFPVEVVRYEDLAESPAAEFARALSSAGFGPVDDAAVAEAVELASFDRLRRAEEEHGFRERDPKAREFFRRGRAGSWRDELPDELAAAIVDAHGETMERFGYEP